jgi:hypothetical protein
MPSSLYPSNQIITSETCRSLVTLLSEPVELVNRVSGFIEILFDAKRQRAFALAEFAPKQGYLVRVEADAR